MTKNHAMDRLVEDAFAEHRVKVPSGDRDYALGYLSSIGSGIMNNLGRRGRDLSCREVFNDCLRPIIDYCAKYVQPDSRKEVLGLFDSSYNGLPKGVISRLTMELAQEAERGRVQLSAEAVKEAMGRLIEKARPRNLVHSA